MNTRTCDVCDNTHPSEEAHEVRRPRPSDPTDIVPVLSTCAECAGGVGARPLVEWAYQEDKAWGAIPEAMTLDEYERTIWNPVPDDLDAEEHVELTPALSDAI